MKKLTLLMLMASLNAADKPAEPAKSTVAALADAFFDVALDDPDAAAVVAEEASDDVPADTSSLTPEEVARRLSRPRRSRAEIMRLRKARHRKQQCAIQ